MKSLMKYSGIKPVEISFEPVLRASPHEPELMEVTRVSDITGKSNKMKLPITEAQLQQWLGQWLGPNGTAIQNVMPHLSNEQREFLVSGCTPEEWQKIVGEETKDE